MKKFEYKIITKHDFDTSEERMLQLLGNEGWELVSVLSTMGGAHHWYFKRSK